MSAICHNIISAFTESVSRYPQRQALIHKGRSVSYGQLLADVKKAASGIQKKGICRGDAVLIFTPVGISLYRTLLALLYIGAVPVFIDEWVSSKRLSLCCGIVRPKALIAPPLYLLLALCLKPLRRIPVKLSPAVRNKPDAASSEPAGVAPGETALITFTTGSTGTPKAAIRTHAILKAQFEALQPLLHERYNHSLTLLPIVVLLNLGLGKTTVLSRISPKNYKPADSDILLKLIEKTKVETITASPFLVTALAKTKAAALLQVKEVITGGGPVLPDEAKLIQAGFAAAKATVVFGSTEAEPISHIEVAVLSGCTAINDTGLPVGSIDSHAQVAIVPYRDGSWPFLTAAQWGIEKSAGGEIGEIVVTGNHVVKAYLQNEEATLLNKIYVDGEVWHRTGDAGRLDASGRLYLYGRCNGIIKIGDRIIYPFLAAYAARQVAGIHDAALTRLDGKPILAVVSSKEAVQKLKEQPLFDGINIREVDVIPKDARHRTKVDEEALVKKLKGA